MEGSRSDQSVWAGVLAFLDSDSTSAEATSSGPQSQDPQLQQQQQQHSPPHLRQNAISSQDPNSRGVWYSLPKPHETEFEEREALEVGLQFGRLSIAPEPHRHLPPHLRSSAAQDAPPAAGPILSDPRPSAEHFSRPPPHLSARSETRPIMARHDPPPITAQPETPPDQREMAAPGRKAETGAGPRWKEEEGKEDAEARPRRKERRPPRRRQRDSTYGRSRAHWPSPANLRRIDRAIEMILPTLMPPRDQLTAVPAQVQARLQDVLRSSGEWGDCRVELFGSSITLLGRPDSDVDMCIMLPTELRLELSKQYDRERPPRPPRRRTQGPEAAPAEDGDTDQPEDGRRRQYPQQQPPREEQESFEEESETGSGDPEERPQYYSYKSYVVDKLVELLEQHNYVSVKGLPRARVPIVKFVDPISSVPPSFFTTPSGLSCDLGIDNHLAVKNSLLIRHYLDFDPRVRPLCYLVKHWTKQRGINDPYRGTLSSYAWVLLVIFVLMRTSPPVLPSLQALLAHSGRKRTPGHDSEGPEMENRVLDDSPYPYLVPLPQDARVINPDPVDGTDCSYVWSQTLVREWPVVSERLMPPPHHARSRRRDRFRSQTLGELLVEFMKFYARSFDFMQACVSVREGRLLAKAAKEGEWVSSWKRDHHRFSIEDPFEVGHDLGRVCDRTALYEIRGEFMRADKQLCEWGDLGTVFEKYDLDDEWRA